ncbi:MAG: lytic transglycosylase domain-containing protein [Clostridiales bacterium]|nr:lytic transglycosylase domain-containing protein [Clostridiales bacterium]
MGRSTLRRPANRRRRRAPFPGGRRRRLAVLAALFLMLAALGAYYATQYRIDQEYARYPLAYRDQIALAAAGQSLGQAHVAAVVLCESSFRPRAVSSEGAMGLMQIMPDTGIWIAGKLGVEGFDVDDLFDPEINLRFGCWYLRWLLDRYDGDMRLATAAYHAGQGSVDRWLADPAYSDDGRTLTAIPFADTREYTGRILAAYEKYKELYDLP